MQKNNHAESLKIALSQVSNYKVKVSLYRTYLINNSAGKQRWSLLTMSMEI